MRGIICVLCILCLMGGSFLWASPPLYFSFDLKRANDVPQKDLWSPSDSVVVVQYAGQKKVFGVRPNSHDPVWNDEAVFLYQPGKEEIEVGLYDKDGSVYQGISVFRYSIFPHVGLYNKKILGGVDLDIEVNIRWFAVGSSELLQTWKVEVLEGKDFPDGFVWELDSLPIDPYLKISLGHYRERTTARLDAGGKVYWQESFQMLCLGGTPLEITLYDQDLDEDTVVGSKTFLPRPGVQSISFGEYGEWGSVSLKCTLVEESRSLSSLDDEANYCLNLRQITCVEPQNWASSDEIYAVAVWKNPQGELELRYAGGWLFTGENVSLNTEVAMVAEVLRRGEAIRGWLVIAEKDHLIKTLASHSDLLSLGAGGIIGVLSKSPWMTVKSAAGISTALEEAKEWVRKVKKNGEIDGDDTMLIQPFVINSALANGKPQSCQTTSGILTRSSTYRVVYSLEPLTQFKEEEIWLGMKWIWTRFGLKLQDIDLWGPAMQAGLSTEDIIVEVEGQEVLFAEPLEELCRQKKKVEVTYSRRGKLHKTWLCPGKKAQTLTPSSLK